MHTQKEVQWTAGVDPVGLWTDMSLPLPHIHTNTTPKKGGGESICIWGCPPIPPDSLDSAVIPTIAKAIHKKGPAHIQSCPPYMVVTATCNHSTKKDERINKCIYTGDGTMGHRGGLE
jgi:hypothetical protein